jgi:hypothetical protein
MLRINMWMKTAMTNTSRATQLHVFTRAALIAVTVATCSVLTAQSAKAITRYEITLTCPIDSQRFTATLMGSYFQSGMRLDFKPIGSLVAPYPYPVCPGNGFVMYKDAFSDNELSAIRAIVLSDEYRQLRIKNTDYFMVAYVKQRLGANHYELGNTYLRASWEAETAKSGLVDQYRRFALQEFDISLHGDGSHDEDWWTTTVLAAELERLLGQFSAVELRISGLPLSKLDVGYPVLKGMLDQIRAHALQRNSAPELMQLPARLDGTIGQAPPHAVK